MSLSRFPLPSIHHVLEAERPDTLPRRPSVITVLDHDQQDASPAMISTLPVGNIGYIPSTSHLMKTIHLRDAEPIATGNEEQLSFIVHFDDDDDLEADSDIDARTIFKEKRPWTSLRLGSSTTKDRTKHAISSLIINAMRKLLPAKPATLSSRTNQP
ncbi:hypothetical protein GALMADRAFT_211111 [Galerina marginata CBS 339.88]|uniref:Uncharacterized protein n=1 Tax=Galerina marginata (strain CBS 339.88) TaxID=685588 RepID=A0A067T9E3_GALM3|nr:hypothetical protein GALMADRAFT_211111 [Galerina marginata CBS 339.88]